MGEYAKYNAQAVLDRVNALIAELETVENTNWDYRRIRRMSSRKVLGRYDGRYTYKYKSTYAFKIGAVYDELSIFDWWNETLSMSQLKQMKKFIEQAIELGFTGYVCFKVGAAGCSHGMWAHMEESTNGYSPDGDVLFHSFRSGDNYWNMLLNGEWMNETIADADDRYKFTLKEIKNVVKGVA